MNIHLICQVYCAIISGLDGFRTRPNIHLTCETCLSSGPLMPHFHDHSKSPIETNLLCPDSYSLNLERVLHGLVAELVQCMVAPQTFERLETL